MHDGGSIDGDDALRSLGSIARGTNGPNRIVVPAPRVDALPPHEWIKSVAVKQFAPKPGNPAASILLPCAARPVFLNRK